MIRSCDPSKDRSCISWGLKTCKQLTWSCKDIGAYSTSYSGRQGFTLRVGQTFDPYYALSNFTSRALDFIDDHMYNFGRETPFFLYVPVNSPHTPHTPHPDFQGKNKAGFGAYADFLEETDHRLGQIMDHLEKWGVTNNTLLIVTSDNGPEGVYKYIRNGLESAHIWSRGKRSLYEGGNRVPFLMQWPNVIPAGVKSEATIGQIDLIKTISELTGANLDGGKDSFSFWEAICNAREPDMDKVRNKQPLVNEIPKSVSGRGPGMSIRCNNIKVFHNGNKWCLFDLEENPKEDWRKNLYKPWLKDGKMAYFWKYSKALNKIIKEGHSDETAVC